ncbi:MAG TPA: hypothetical protein VIJ25_00560, partial [Methylococcales bacterium]
MLVVAKTVGFLHHKTNMAEQAATQSPYIDPELRHADAWAECLVDEGFRQSFDKLVTATRSLAAS